MRTKAKRKIGTVLDEELYRALKVYAATRKKPISEVIEDALNDYLRRERRNVVDDTFGIIKIEPKALEEILEEDYYDQ